MILNALTLCDLEDNLAPGHPEYPWATTAVVVIVPVSTVRCRLAWLLPVVRGRFAASHTPANHSCPLALLRGPWLSVVCLRWSSPLVKLVSQAS